MTGPSGWQGLPDLNITFLCVCGSLFVFITSLCVLYYLYYHCVFTTVCVHHFSVCCSLFAFITSLCLLHYLCSSLLCVLTTICIDHFSVCSPLFVFITSLCVCHYLYSSLLCSPLFVFITSLCVLHYFLAPTSGTISPKTSGTLLLSLQKSTQVISLLRIFQLNHIVLHSHQSVQCVCV